MEPSPPPLPHNFQKNSTQDTSQAHQIASNSKLAHNEIHPTDTKDHKPQIADLVSKMKNLHDRMLFAICDREPVIQVSQSQTNTTNEIGSQDPQTKVLDTSADLRVLNAIKLGPYEENTHDQLSNGVAFSESFDLGTQLHISNNGDLEIERGGPLLQSEDLEAIMRGPVYF